MQWKYPGGCSYVLRCGSVGLSAMCGGWKSLRGRASVSERNGIGFGKVANYLTNWVDSSRLCWLRKKK